MIVRTSVGRSVMCLISECKRQNCERGEEGRWSKGRKYKTGGHGRQKKNKIVCLCGSNGREKNLVRKAFDHATVTLGRISIGHGGECVRAPKELTPGGHRRLPFLVCSWYDQSRHRVATNFICLQGASNRSNQ